MRDFLLIALSALSGAGIAYFLVWRRPNPLTGATEPRLPRASAGPGAEEILEKMGEGALVLDESLKPIFANRAARALLGFQGTRLPDRIPSEEIAELAKLSRRDGAAEEEIAVLFPLPMTLRVRAMRLQDGSATLVLLQDMTQEAMAQRVRREFVAHASHELKSPVAGLQAIAEALSSAVDDDPEAARRFSERMVGEADRLGQLVRDLLDLSRIEDPVSAPRESVDLSEVAKQTLEQIAPRAESKGILIQNSVAPGVGVIGDERQLRLMIRNLLENAIRYTPDGGEICLEVTANAAEARVTVVDNGIGIPRDAHARVFERFYRLDRGRTRERGGTGLGLAIVKHVAELHRGWVDLSSELGEGSTFTVHLPSIDEEEEAQLDEIAG